MSGIIETMSPKSGRVYKEDSTVVNEAELLATQQADIASIKGGIPVAANYILGALPTKLEVMTHWPKNRVINTEQTAVQIAKPLAPVLMYVPAMTVSSIDTDVLAKFFNRLTFLVTGTAQAGGDATHIVLDPTANPTNDHYNGFVLTIVSGKGAGQVKTIVDYAGATVTAEVSAWTGDTPDATSVYSIALVRDVLVAQQTFAKAVLTAPIVKANQGAIITGLFAGGSDVYVVLSNTVAIPNADASRFTSVLQLIPIA
jgi:hypothetical protein